MRPRAGRVGERSSARRLWSLLRRPSRTRSPRDRTDDPRQGVQRKAGLFADRTKRKPRVVLGRQTTGLVPQLVRHRALTWPVWGQTQDGFGSAATVYLDGPRDRLPRNELRLGNLTAAAPRHHQGQEQLRSVPAGRNRRWAPHTGQEQLVIMGGELKSRSGLLGGCGGHLLWVIVMFGNWGPMQPPSALCQWKCSPNGGHTPPNVRRMGATLRGFLLASAHLRTRQHNHGSPNAGPYGTAAKGPYIHLQDLVHEARHSKRA